MADSLHRAFQKFDLGEKEAGAVDLSWGDVEEGRKECRLSLVGRIMGEKIANFTGVKNFTNHVWGYPRNMRVTELGPNVFMFNFKEEKDKERALKGRPWVLDNQLLVLKQWSEGIEMDPEGFNTSYMWIQVWQLPIHWLCRASGFKSGELFQAVKDVIIPPGGGKEGKHMKILAEIDISQSLVRGCPVKHNGVEVWAEFRYERCPDFCYKCGVIGHSDKTCNFEVKTG